MYECEVWCGWGAYTWRLVCSQTLVVVTQITNYVTKCWGQGLTQKFRKAIPPHVFGVRGRSPVTPAPLRLTYRTKHSWGSDNILIRPASAISVNGQIWLWKRAWNPILLINYFILYINKQFLIDNIWELPFKKCHFIDFGKMHLFDPSNSDTFATQAKWIWQDSDSLQPLEKIRLSLIKTAPPPLPQKLTIFIVF